MNLTTSDIKEFTQRNSSLIAVSVSLLLLVVVVVVIGLNTYDERTTKNNDYAPQNTSPVARNGNDQGIRSDVVIRANLFGSSAPKVIVTAPKTTLNLTLKGILSANSAEYARAIIQVDKKASKLYSIGDEIKGSGAKLEEIRINEDLLNRSGAIESLALTKLGNQSGASISITSGLETADISSGSTKFAALSNQNNLSQNSDRSRRVDKSNKQDDSPNGPRRKIKRPAFSGIDRAIKKADEI